MKFISRIILGVREIVLLILLALVIQNISAKHIDIHSYTKNQDTAVHKSHRYLIKNIHNKYQFKKEQHWDSISGFKPEKKHKPLLRRHPKYKVLGWHMFSEGSAYKNYNFSLLTGVIYFDAELNLATGGFKNIHAWKTTALIDSAKSHGCKTYLCVSNFGGKNNNAFLSDTKIQENFTDSITNLLKLRNADGVVIDFEQIRGEDRENFTQFIKTLSKKLNSPIKKHEVIVCLYAVDYNNVFDVKALNKHVSNYILMGYDYYGSFSKETGPVSPLHDMKKRKNYSVEHSVNSYIKKGVSPKNIILGLPCYGAKWQTKDKNIPSVVEKFISSPTYTNTENKEKEIVKELGYDKTGISAYLIGGNSKRPTQTWFDDSLTLSIKFNWAKYKKLGGISPWTLNYCNGNNSIWQLLYQTFGKGLEKYTKYNVQELNSKVLIRAKTLNYFIANDSIIKIKKDNHKPWESAPTAQKKSENNKYELYAFYPFWKDDSGLLVDFSLYTRIGYFAILPDLNTGEIKQAFNWSKLDISVAQKLNCKVDLVVAGFNHNSSSKIWIDNNVSKNLSKNLINLLEQSKGNGITIDFGYISESNSQSFINFVVNLKNKLLTVDKSHKLSLILPPAFEKTNAHFAYNIKELNNAVDFYLLTSFDNHNNKTFNINTQSTPLANNHHHADINSSVLKYKSIGLPLEKTIIVYPFFGKQWKNTNENKVVKLISNDFFSKKVKPISSRIANNKSHTPKFKYTSNNTTYHVLIEDTASITKKCKYIIEEEMAGIGIWALGYDSKENELTKIAASHLIEKIKPISNYMNEFLEIGWIVNICLLSILTIILLLSIKICLVKSFVKKYTYMFYGLGFILFVATYFLINKTQSIPNDGNIAIIAFVLIVSIIVVKNLYDKNERKDYP